MKIVQIISEPNDNITALTDDGRIFVGYWKNLKFYWYMEITPDEKKLVKLPYCADYVIDQD